MSSSSGSSKPVPAPPHVEERKRRRGVDQPKRYGDDMDVRPMKPAAVHVAPADQKAVSKNPMRNVPDFTGFGSLSDSEIDNDCKAINARASFAVEARDITTTQDTEGIMRTTRPPAAPESNILRKRRRYLAWANGPGKMNEDMCSYHNAVQHVHKSLRDAEREEDRWHGAFEFARRQITSSYKACLSDNNSLARDSEELKDLCCEEMGRPEARKTKGFVKDAVHEMVSRQEGLERLLDKYEGLLVDLNQRVPEDSQPILYLELDEKTGERWKEPESSAAPATSSTSSEEKGGMEGVSTLQSETNSSRERRSTRRSEAAKESKSKIATEVHLDPKMRLEGMLRPLEDQLRLSEAELGDVAPFFPQEDDDWVLSSEVAAKVSANENPTTANKWKALPGKEMEHQLAEPYLKLRTPASWHGLTTFLNEGLSALEALSAISKPSPAASHVEEFPAPCRPRRTVPKDQLTLKSFVVPETPRGAPLLLSALSQHPDRYCAVMLGAGQAYDFETACSNSKKSSSSGKFRSSQEFKAALMTLPPELTTTENEYLEKCNLHSAIAAAKNKKRRLMKENSEWGKFALQSENSLKKVKSLSEGVEHNLLFEARTHRKELVHYGLAVPNKGEEMSPLSTNYNLDCMQQQSAGVSFKSIKGKAAPVKKSGAFKTFPQPQTATNGEAPPSLLSSSSSSSSHEELPRRTARSTAAAEEVKSPETLKREKQMATLNALKSKVDSEIEATNAEEDVGEKEKEKETGKSHRKGKSRR